VTASTPGGRKGRTPLPAAMPGSLFSREILFDLGTHVKSAGVSHEGFISPRQKEHLVKDIPDLTFGDALQCAVTLDFRVHPWMPDGVIVVVGECLMCSGSGQRMVREPDHLTKPLEPVPPEPCGSCKGTGKAMCALRLPEGQAL
jgi:hypothetical protein